MKNNNGTKINKLPDDNNLKSYLEHQVKEYKSECDNLNALLSDLIEHIDECNSQIHSLKAKEDIGFSLLSPVAVDSAYQTQIKRLNAQLDTYNKQKEKYMSDLRFYETKIHEMESQLSEFQQAENERLKMERAFFENASSNEMTDTRFGDHRDSSSADYVIIDTDEGNVDSSSEYDDTSLNTNNTNLSSNQQIYRNASNKEDNDSSITVLNESVKILQSQVEEAKSNAAALQVELEQCKAQYDNTYTFVLRKLNDIKGYMNFDFVRAKLEIEQLEEYVKQSASDSE